MHATRRDFLKTCLGTSTLLSLFPTVPAFLTRTACAVRSLPEASDTVLVVVQLAGGNDGLNTVVPYGDDLYARNRQTLRLTAKEVLKIDSLLGFHPQMEGLFRLWKEGLLTVVQGVGYPNPSESHSTAMLAWQTAHPEQPEWQTGWLGQAADRLSSTEKADVPVVFVGQTPRPVTLNARRTIVPSLRALNDYRFQGPPGIALPPRQADRDELLEFVECIAAAAYASSRKIDEIIHAPTRVGYPAGQFADSLRTIAQLIRVDVGIRIYHAELGGAEPGGFDCHANQRDNHAALLRQLSNAVAAFVEDLRRDHLLDRVLLMTFSEFGRTVAENGRRGTDHGSAAPLLLAGGRLRGGLVGPHPKLDALDKGGLAHHTDFRQVYATLLDRWLCLDSQQVLNARFTPLDILAI